MAHKTFTQEYKQKIVEEAKTAASIKDLLAREGITPSHLQAFRNSILTKQAKTPVATPPAMASDMSDVVVKKLDKIEAVVTQASEPSKQLLEIQSKLDQIYKLLTDHPV